MTNKKRASSVTKTKQARPEITARLVNIIIRRVAAGETLTAICREEGMPSYARVTGRINQSSSLVSAYARARELRHERMADELLDIAEDGTNDFVEKQGRNGAFVALAEEHVRRSQLRIDTRKWLLSKLLPARFGDRVEHTGAGGGAIQVEHGMSAKMLESLTALRARLPVAPGVGLDAVPAPIDVTPSKR